MVMVLGCPLRASFGFLQTPVLRSGEFESSSVGLGGKISRKASDARKIVHSYRLDDLVFLTLALYADRSKYDTLRGSSLIRPVFQDSQLVHSEVDMLEKVNANIKLTLHRARGPFSWQLQARVHMRRSPQH
jgi:hypothetical protein